MRLVTLNTWKGDGAYAKRLAAMAAGLKALAPDVIAVQEALASPTAGHDTAAHLAAGLGMATAALPLRRKPREVEGSRVDSTSGLAILSRRPIRSQRAVPLTSDLRDGERVALVAEIEAPGGMLTIVGVHLTHLADRDDLRRRQWQDVQAAVAGRDAAIVAGDFNAPIDQFELGRFTDSRQACGQPATPTYVDGTSTACIDHVLFAGHRLTAASWRTTLDEPPPGHDVCPSDHCAVVVDFTFG